MDEVERESRAMAATSTHMNGRGTTPTPTSDLHLSAKESDLFSLSHHETSSPFAEESGTKEIVSFHFSAAAASRKS